MQCGISTSCFFPQETLEALRLLGSNGIQVTEIFLNTCSETEDKYISQLQNVAQQHNIRVSSVHPWSSPMEGFFFASDYNGRLNDGIKLYRRYFEVCSELGADKLVFHGSYLHAKDSFSFEKYVEHFCILAQIGREYGVTLCHENVSYCILANPDTARSFSSLAGQDAAFVLDTKQAYRFGIDAIEMLDAMQQVIRHIHISDYSAQSFCLPPGQGQLDFKHFLNRLFSLGYKGDLIIELYRDNFDGMEQLIQSKKYIDTILRNIGAQ